MAHGTTPKDVYAPPHESSSLLLSDARQQHHDYMAMNLQGASNPVCTPKERNWLMQAQQRQQALTAINSICQENVQETFFADTFCRLFLREDVLNLFFQLFDHKSKGQLAQSDLIESFRLKLGKDGTELVDLLDTLCYVFANEADLNFQIFCRLWQSKGVLLKLFSFVDVNKTGMLSITQLMTFINELTQEKVDRDMEILQPGRVEELFRSIVKENSLELGFEEFRKLIPGKNPFFAKRIFHIFDKDGSNTISLAEFREGFQQFCCQSDEDKVRCLFQIYDQTGTGLIQLEDLKSVLKACSEENGMKFSEKQLDQLTIALYDDARDKAKSRTESKSGVGFEELRIQMLKHPGLLDNLSISLDRLLLPTTPKAPNRASSTSSLLYYVKNNTPFHLFVIAYVIVNLGLFISRAIQFKDERIIYIVARAAGQALNFNCAFILVLMLRHCITLLRQIGCASFLPLDQHVYLHKLCGAVVAFFSALHTAMHLINFPMYIADEVESRITEKKHTVVEWLFTITPGMFGLIPGTANLTGWALVAILVVMVICSIPSVRKGGSFEVFYWTHLLYIPFWGLLIIHGPRFWMWFIGPGVLYVFVEGTRKLRFRYTDIGRSFISSAVLLPSRVTHLVIRKPANFNAHPGDYVFVKIPAIASNEWHPFTISSAPELQDFMWLHIRCAGGWTNKLYEYFEREQAKLCLKKEQLDATAHHSSETTCCHCKHVMDNTSGSTTQQIMKSVRRLTQMWASPPKEHTHDLGSLELLNSHGQTPKRSEEFLTSSIPDLRPSNRLSFCTRNLTSLNQSNTSLIDNPEFGAHGRRDVYGYLRQRPEIVSIYVPNKGDNPSGENRNELAMKKTLPRASYAPETIRKQTSQVSFRNSEAMGSIREERQVAPTNRNAHIYYPLEIAIDGPYGAPSSHIFRAEHAVLVAAGIGATPFASILQSIMYRYYASQHSCPRCKHKWVTQMPDTIINLKKVDFFWINRDQRSFEWFVDMLSQLEMEQAEMGGVFDRFLDLHMYITSALKKTDMKAVGLQMALDLLHAKEKRDLVTGLKTRTNAGRPNWDKVFQKLVDEDKGKVTVFYCGPPQLAKDLSKKCNEFGFNFRKEIF